MIGAAVVAAAFILRPAPKVTNQSDWGSTAAAGVDLIKWGYNEFWGDDDNDKSSAGSGGAWV